MLVVGELSTRIEKRRPKQPVESRINSAIERCAFRVKTRNSIVPLNARGESLKYPNSAYSETPHYQEYTTCTVLASAMT